MKKLLSTAAIAAVTASLVVSACGVSKRDFESVSAENESIKAENESLASNLKEVNDKAESLQEIINKNFISAHRTQLGKMHFKYPSEGYSTTKSDEKSLAVGGKTDVLMFSYNKIENPLVNEGAQHKNGLMLLQNDILTDFTDGVIKSSINAELKNQEFTKVLDYAALKTDFYSNYNNIRYENIIYVILYDTAIYTIMYANQDNITDTSVLDFALDNIKFGQ